MVLLHLAAVRQDIEGLRRESSGPAGALHHRFEHHRHDRCFVAGAPPTCLSRLVAIDEEVSDWRVNGGQVIVLFACRISAGALMVADVSPSKCFAFSNHLDRFTTYDRTHTRVELQQ